MKAVLKRLPVPLKSRMYQLKVDNLLSSFDGIAIGEPPENGNTKFAEDFKPSLHLDQGPQRVGLHAFQGAVYLEQADDDDWCFQVLETSHKHHNDFFKQFPPNPHSEFRPLSDMEIEWLKGRWYKHVRVPVSKGAIVLWDSRKFKLMNLCNQLSTGHLMDPHFFVTKNRPMHRLDRAPRNSKNRCSKITCRRSSYDSNDVKPNGPTRKPVKVIQKRTKKSHLQIKTKYLDWCACAKNSKTSLCGPLQIISK